MADEHLGTMQTDHGTVELNSEDLLYLYKDPSGAPVDRATSGKKISQWAHVADVSGTSVSQIAFTSIATGSYMHKIVIPHVTVATDAVYLYMQFSHDNGSTWENSNYQSMGGSGNYPTYAYPAQSSNSASGILLSRNSTGSYLIGNDTNEYLGGYEIILTNLTESEHVLMRGFGQTLNANTDPVLLTTNSHYASTTAVDAIRILASSGNITVPSAKPVALYKYLGD